jgi:steroid 5-alpha reductase family enzyme
VFVAIAWTVAVARPDAHSWLLAGLVTVWGGRLAWHVFRRSRGDGEDPRYAEMLGDAGWWTVVRRVFATQGVVAWLVALPVMVAGDQSVVWWPLVWVGVAVWAVGLFFETVGDAQLAAYRSRPREERPPVMDQGLWGWTRHPNYFGDACVWWGIWLAGALATGWLPGLATVVAPVAMTYFIRNVTGAKLLERTMSQRPGWDEYAARVPLFFPRPPRRG